MRQILERILMAWTGGALMVLMLTVFVDVIGRNAFNRPLASSTEITELAMIAMAFSAFPLIILNSRNIRVELFELKPGQITYHVIELLTALAAVLLFSIMARQYYIFSERTARTGEMMSQLGLPWTWIWWALLIGAIVTIITASMAALLEMQLIVLSFRRSFR